MRVLCLLLCCLVGLALPRPAWSACIAQPAVRTMLPTSGATDVPVDVVIRVLFSGDWIEGLPALLGDELRLRGPEGELVPMGPAEVEPYSLALRPRRPLAPETTYVVETVVVWQNGEALDDDDRQGLAYARGRPNDDDDGDGSTLRWTPLHVFTTGSTVSRRAPAPPVVLSAEYASYRGGCGGPGESVWGDVELAEDLVGSEVIEVDFGAQGILWRGRAQARLPGQEGLLRAHYRVADGGCAAPEIHVDVTEGVRLRTRILGSNGAPGAWSPWQEASRHEDSLASGEPHPEHHGVGEPQTEERRVWQEEWTALARAGFFDLPWSAPLPGGAVPRPESCPHGPHFVGEPTFEHALSSRSLGRPPQDDEGLPSLEVDGLGDARVTQVLPRPEGGSWALMETWVEGEPDVGPREQLSGVWVVELAADGRVEGRTPLDMPQHTRLLSDGEGGLLALRPSRDGTEVVALDEALRPVGPPQGVVGGVRDAVVHEGALWLVGSRDGWPGVTVVSVCGVGGTCTEPWPLFDGHRVVRATLAVEGEVLRLSGTASGTAGWVPLSGELSCAP